MLTAFVIVVLFLEKSFEFLPSAIGVLYVALSVSAVKYHPPNVPVRAS